MVTGPYTPGFVANRDVADQFAEVGVILLMFGVGLQFHFKELLEVRKVALPGAFGQSLVATSVGTLIGVLAGWGWTAGLIFGLSISVASTVVLVRVLSDSGDLHTRSGHIAMGWLVVEDLYTVFVLVMLPVFFGPGQGGVAAILGGVGIAIVKIAAMVGLTILVGERVIPWLLDRVAATRSRELFTLTVLGVALGIAVGSARLFGVSMALGAFLAGMVVGRSEFSLRAATDALPMRDAFAVLFFASVGILFRPQHLLEAPGLVAATVAYIVLVKPVVVFTLVWLLGYPVRVAVSVGLALGQIGEFSFILAATGESLGLLDDRATNTLIAAALISISINPLLYRLAGPLERWLRPSLDPRGPVAAPVASGAVAELSSNPADERHRAVIAGHGPVGRTLARLLRENHFDPVIVELNLDTVRAIKDHGGLAVYGDATAENTLAEAGLAGAVALILSSEAMPNAAEAIRAAKRLNPDVLVFARSNYITGYAGLRGAGADVIVSDETEVALAMTQALMQHLGATPDQLDRERARIREELHGSPTPDVARPV